MLKKAFGKFPSFAMAKVVRNKRNNQTRGYGFVSFLDPNDYADAFREFNGMLGVDLDSNENLFQLSFAQVSTSGIGR